MKPLGAIPGTIEDLRWTSDGAALVVLAADRGLDGGATNGAKRLRGATKRIRPSQPDGRRGGGCSRSTRPTATTWRSVRAELSVWEFDLLGDDGAMALVSDDASERGWYHATLARLDFDRARRKILHQSHWQLQGPAASPSGERVAFLEGWSSDRGLVASEIRILDLASGKVTSLAADRQSDVTTLSWRDEESLWFAGWSQLGSTYGVVRLDGTFEWIRARGRRHRPEQLLGRDLAGAGQDRICRDPRDRRRAAGDRLQGASPKRTGRRSQR